MDSPAWYSDEEDISLYPVVPSHTVWDARVTSHPALVVSHQDDEANPRADPDPEPDNQTLHRRNSIPKGQGADSKREKPDPHDSYNYQEESPAFHCLQDLGYQGIVLGALWKVMDKVQDAAEEHEIAGLLTHRNRTARRRKPCAFHWLDENWSYLEDIFKTAVQEVLRDTTGLKRRGRPKRAKWPAYSWT
jgi:hypothetical protein